MRAVNNILLLLLALLAVLAPAARAAAITDPGLLAILREAPEAKDYPRDSAVWLRRDMEITVAANGGTVVRERRLIKILTTQGQALANWEIPYDASCEKLEVRTARTLLNGQAFPVDPGSVSEGAVYPGVAWYDTLVVRRFPLPAALPGAVLEVETVISRPVPRIAGEFSTRLHLRQPYPILKAYTTIRTPEKKPLTIRFAGGDAPAVSATVEKGTRVYRWRVLNAPALPVDEAGTPPYADICPSARIGSLTSWAPVASWYRAITAGKAVLTDDLRAVALERTKDCHTPAERVAALHRAVSELPYVAMEMGTLSDVPHPADAVLKQNYGDCKDKATLLKALLAAVEIRSDYVLVRTTDLGALDRALYSPGEFNHVILVAHLVEGDRYLDATTAGVPATLLPAGVEGADALVTRGTGTLVTLPASEAAQNATEIDLRVAVQPDGSAAGQAELRFTGQLAALQRGMLLPVPPERYREALEGTLAPRLGSEVAATAVTVAHLLDPDQPLVLTAQFTSPAYLQDAGPQRSGSLPAFAYQPNAFRTVTTRTLPYYVSLASSMRLTAVITLPEGSTVVKAPAPVQYDGPLGRFADQVAMDGRTLTYTCDLAARRGTFPPAMLEAIKTWSALLAQEKRNGLQFFVTP